MCEAAATIIVALGMLVSGVLLACAYIYVVTKYGD